MFKKLLISLVIFVFGGLGLLWFLGGREITNPSGELGLSANAVSSLPEKRTVTDTDGDSIPDWEETLLGTNPLNSDTDGDKVADSKEKPKNPDESALELIREAMRKKKAPLLAADDLTAWVNTSYTLANLNLVAEEEKEFLNSYAKNLAKIMSALNNPGLGYETALVLKMVEAGDLSDKEKIVQATNRYELIIKNLLALPAPESAGQIHLNLINALAQLQNDSLIMEQISSEPTLALSAANLTPGHLRLMLNAIYNLNLFFAGHNLAFNEGERAQISLDV